MGRIEDYRDLEVYQQAFSLQQHVFEVTRAFPRSETYSLTDQLRRSSRSIGANIAEAWKKRRYPAHFRSKLTDSDAELAETRHWLQTAESCGYLDAPDRVKLEETAREVGRMLGAMIRDAEQWCTR